MLYGNQEDEFEIPLEQTEASAFQTDKVTHPPQKETWQIQCAFYINSFKYTQNDKLKPENPSSFRTRNLFHLTVTQENPVAQTQPEGRYAKDGRPQCSFTHFLVRSIFPFLILFATRHPASPHLVIQIHEHHFAKTVRLSQWRCCDSSKAVKTCKRRVKNTTFTVANGRNVGRSWNYNGHSKFILLQSLEGNLGFLSTNRLQQLIYDMHMLYYHVLMALECLRSILGDIE